MGFAGPSVGLCGRCVAGAWRSDDRGFFGSARHAREEVAAALFSSGAGGDGDGLCHGIFQRDASDGLARSEEHTSELQSLMRISYAAFCLKKKISLTIPSSVTKCTDSSHHRNTI